MQRDAADHGTGRANRFEGRAKRRALRVIRRVIAVAVLIGACMWSFIAWSLWSEYSAAMAIGRTEGHNLTAAFAFELTLALDAVDAELRLIGNELAEIANGTLDAAALAHRRQVVATTIGSDARLRIATADGRMAFSLPDSDSEPADFRDRPHFIAHRDNPSDRLTVDPDVAGNGDMPIEVSRRLETADGTFAGEAVLQLKPANLVTLTRQIDLGSDGMIAIVDDNGIVRAGFDRDHPAGQVAVGTDLRDSAFPGALEPGGRAVFSHVGGFGLPGRQITMQRLDSYNVLVLVALDLDDILNSVRMHGLLVGLIGVGATGLIVGLTLLLLREVWRRMKREIDLACDRDRLRSAQAQIAADRARLAETNSALLASRDSAEAANRARSQFLAHMSHELRTPLHAIIGFSELIQDQAPTKPGSPPIGSYAADILSSGRHLLELINSILDISKVESGTAKLAESAFVVADLVRTSLVSVHAQAEARNIAIELDLPETALRIRADRTRLLQILINLLSNAVKFTPDNGRIVVAVVEPVATPSEIVFSITDTGIGMTEEEVAIALEPFGQVDNTLSRPFEGTGLGLSLARKLTELHGGRLDVASTKGRGTTARVILPAERLVQRDGVRVGGA